MNNELVSTTAVTYWYEFKMAMSPLSTVYMHPPAYMQSQSDRIGRDKHIKCVRHLRDIEPEEGHFCFELTKSNLLNCNTYESKSPMSNLRHLV